MFGFVDRAERRGKDKGREGVGNRAKGKLRKKGGRRRARGTSGMETKNAFCFLFVAFI